jgi:hypothetical protein
VHFLVMDCVYHIVLFAGETSLPQAATLVNCIRQLPGLNLCPNIKTGDCGLSWGSQTVAAVALSEVLTLLLYHKYFLFVFK